MTLLRKSKVLGVYLDGRCSGKKEAKLFAALLFELIKARKQGVGMPQEIALVVDEQGVADGFIAMHRAQDQATAFAAPKGAF